MNKEIISYEVLLDNLPDGVFFVDMDRRITYWNNGAERITGYSKADVVGNTCPDDFLGHFDHKGVPLFERKTPVLLTLKDAQTRDFEVFLQHHDHSHIPALCRISPIRNPRGDIIGALEVFSENSANIQEKQHIEELEEMALLCPLTGVGNRRYTLMALHNAFEEFRRYNWGFSVLFIDIDHFKDVNDTYGHAIGDDVLCMVAQTLDNSLRSFDFVGRWGGEEFVIILPNITEDMLTGIAERCRRLIEESCFQHQGKTIPITISIGGVLARPEETPEECLHRADQCMYQSKTNGRNRVTLENEITP